MRASGGSNTGKGRSPSARLSALAGVAFALLAIALGSARVLLLLAVYWLLASTAAAFSFGAAARALLDSPDMQPRSMEAIARAADDTGRPRVVRRTAAALYLYMAGVFFCLAAVGTILLVSFVFFRG